MRKLASIGRDPRDIYKVDMYPLDLAAQLFAETKDDQVGERRTCKVIILTLVAHVADPNRTYLDGTMSIVDRIIKQGRRVDSILLLFGVGRQDHVPNAR